MIRKNLRAFNEDKSGYGLLFIVILIFAIIIVVCI